MSVPDSELNAVLHYLRLPADIRQANSNGEGLH